MTRSALYRNLDRGVEAAPCFPVVVGHLADALELPWPSPEASEALALLEEPVILRGGARSFLLSSPPSSSSEENRWSLDALARRNPTQRVLVRAAPSPSFPVPNGNLLPLVVAAFGVRAAPSLASFLPLREAAERMQVGCPLPPLAFSSSSSSSPFSSLSSFFSSPSSSSFPAASPNVVSDGAVGGRREWYYIQSEVPREWLGEGKGEGDSSPLSALVLPASGGGGAGSSTPPPPPGRTVSQDFRLWLSPPNAVSPLHWDVSSSALAVLSGNKTLHFWTPETLGALEPRSEWSLLRRRCKADPSTTTRGGGKGRRSCPPAALRAVVRAGDAVAFPPLWAHHVLSHGEDDGEEGSEGRERRAPTGRPIVALTRRASNGVGVRPPRRPVVPSPRLLWGGLGGAARL